MISEDIKKKILGEVKKIKKGIVKSYKEIGDAVGVHARVVAAVLKKNFDRDVPCHRVIMNDGRVGGYNRGKDKKIFLLKREGVKIKNGSVVDKL